MTWFRWYSKSNTLGIARSIELPNRMINLVDKFGTLCWNSICHRICWQCCYYQFIVDLLWFPLSKHLFADYDTNQFASISYTWWSLSSSIPQERGMLLHFWFHCHPYAKSKVINHKPSDAFHQNSGKNIFHSSDFDTYKVHAIAMTALGNSFIEGFCCAWFGVVISSLLVVYVPLLFRIDTRGPFY